MFQPLSKANYYDGAAALDLIRFAEILCLPGI